MKTPTTTYRLDAETLGMIDALGAHLGLSATAVVKLAVREFVKKLKLTGG